MFFYRLRLVDLYADEHYLISLILSLCWEPAECVDHHIFTNAVLPKPTCDWRNEFKVKGKIIYNLEMKYILLQMFSPTEQHNSIFFFDEYYTLSYKSSASHAVKMYFISFTPYQRFLKLTRVLQF